MLASLQGRASDRKLRLFGTACARRWPGLCSSAHDWAVLDAIELYADGLATPKGVLAMARRTSKGDVWDDETLPTGSQRWWETVTFLLGPLDHVGRFAERVTRAVHTHANDRDAVRRAPGGQEVL